MKIRLYWVLIAAFISLASVEAQDKQGFSPKMLVYENLDNAKVLNSFRARFAELDTLLKHRTVVCPPLARIKMLTGDFENVDSLFAAKTAYEELALRSHNGLEITGQAYGRLDEQFHLDEEDDVSVYRAKAQAELGWNIINSRFYQGKDKYNKISLANELDRLQMLKRQQTGMFDVMVDSITKEYNFYICVLLTHRLKNLDIMNTAYQYMLEQDRISNDDMLNVMNEKMDVEYQLSMIDNYKDVENGSLYTIMATRLDVDTAALWKYIDEGSIDGKISKTKEDIAENESRLTNYLSTMRLTPFFRWSSYLTSTNRISNNADLGVRFTIPLWNESGRKKKALETEKEIIRSDRSDNVKRVRTECELRLKRINQLNVAISTEKYHIDQLKRYVGIRRNAYNKRSENYNYLTRMQEYNEYLKSMERLCRLMLTRAQTMIDIQKAASLPYTGGITLETEI